MVPALRAYSILKMRRINRLFKGTRSNVRLPYISLHDYICTDKLSFLFMSRLFLEGLIGVRFPITFDQKSNRSIVGTLANANLNLVTSILSYPRGGRT